MTFKELLNCVKFEDVAPHIVKMYPDMKNSLGWFNLHFDMLRHLPPVVHEDANDKVCHITLRNDENGTESYLDAFPMEGDYWEHSLTKEIIVDSDVKATNEELVACCLWHTSFYGFVEKHLDEKFGEICLGRDSYSYNKVWTMRNYGIIRKYGGTIPTIRELSMSKKQKLTRLTKDNIWYGSNRLNKSKRKRMFRQEFMVHYYERMAHISEFIVQAIPALDNGKNYLTTEQLCELFQSENFCSEEIMSFADDNESGANYLMNIISRYDMVQRMDGIVVCLITGTRHEVLSDNEQRLCNYLTEGRKHSDLIIGVDTSLGNQVIIRYAAYNSKTNII
ncbi:DUF6557 family protein [Bacteroides xylanisolvens]|uniref:DUF6557 family protein n=1 Tax=Bacteroides xylanisolvens TaxID=371601 RepID=UPI00189AA95D|nr:DUF6557 family protein [Bacteroides xylanisolvens]